MADEAREKAVSAEAASAVDLEIRLRRTRRR
jgi:hypothetical protein